MLVPPNDCDRTARLRLFGRLDAAPRTRPNIAGPSPDSNVAPPTRVCKRAASASGGDNAAGDCALPGSDKLPAECDPCDPSVVATRLHSHRFVARPIVDSLLGSARPQHCAWVDEEGSTSTSHPGRQSTSSTWSANRLWSPKGHHCLRAAAGAGPS